MRKPEVTYTTVMLHGFTILPCGGHEHMDFDDPECRNWNVWVREDYATPREPHGEPFGSVDEHDQDFTDYDKASAYARGLADQLGAGLDEY